MNDTIYGLPIVGTITSPADIEPAIWRAIAERAATAEHGYEPTTPIIAITPETRFRPVIVEAGDE